MLTMSKRNLVKTHKKRIDRLVKAGKALEAKKLYFELCNTSPGDERAWLAAGEFAEQLGHTEDAGRAFHRAIAINPNLSTAYLKLANCQAELGFYDSAIQSFHNCLLLTPDSTEALHRYARLLAKLGRFDESHEKYLQALAQAPATAPLLLDLGDLYKKQGLNKQALQHYLDAKSLAPDDPNIHVNLGLLYCKTGDTDKALASFKQFQRQLPAAKGVYEYYAATVAEEQGQFAEAECLYRKAIQLNPGSAKTHTAHALNLLRQGKWEEGWSEHEWRLRRSDWKQQPGHRPIAAIPQWTGRSLQGKTVLVNAEQGYGDALQFCRYLALLKKHCDTILVYCRLPLYRILSALPCVATIIARPENLPTHRVDICIHMMSLPYVLSTLDNESDEHNTEIPYLFSPPPSITLKKEMAFDGLRVGLAWRGNPSHPKNSQRSLMLSQLSPWASTENIRFFSLQKRLQSESQETPPEGMNLVDLNEHISDFHDLATIIGMLDLVISVDTAVAHLAGALGKPVWNMLYFPADWRWQIEGADTHWYSTMRLFRQDKTKQWTPVIEEVGKALAYLNTNPQM